MEENIDMQETQKLMVVRVEERDTDPLKTIENDAHIWDMCARLNAFIKYSECLFILQLPGSGIHKVKTVKPLKGQFLSVMCAEGDDEFPIIVPASMPFIFFLSRA